MQRTLRIYNLAFESEVLRVAIKTIRSVKMNGPVKLSLVGNLFVVAILLQTLIEEKHFSCYYIIRNVSVL